MLIQLNFQGATADEVLEAVRGFANIGGAIPLTPIATASAKNPAGPKAPPPAAIPPPPAATNAAAVTGATLEQCRALWTTKKDAGLKPAAMTKLLADNFGAGVTMSTVPADRMQEFYDLINALPVA